MSRTIGLLITIVGGIAIAAGVGLGATSLVASEQPIDPEQASVEAGEGSSYDVNNLFIYGSR